MPQKWTAPGRHGKRRVGLIPATSTGTPWTVRYEVLRVAGAPPTVVGLPWEARFRRDEFDRHLVVNQAHDGLIRAGRSVINKLSTVSVPS